MRLSPVAIDRLRVTELLVRYLETISGRRVLTGQSRRGDAQTFNCVLFFSDMRDSLSLSQSLPPNCYLDLLNLYFDCTAGAVIDHGGEVLKFIGDGVLAIFPVDEDTRPRSALCAAALAPSGRHDLRGIDAPVTLLSFAP